MTNQTTDNPTCPACGHYNAMLSGVCRDCCHADLVLAPKAAAEVFVVMTQIGELSWVAGVASTVEVACQIAAEDLEAAMCEDSLEMTDEQMDAVANPANWNRSGNDLQLVLPATLEEKVEFTISERQVRS